MSKSKTILTEIKKAEWPILGLILVICTALFFSANQCGLGYTFDTFLYFDIAERISSDDFWQNEGFNFKPPAYPILIKIIGQENLIWANLGCFYFSAFITFLFSKEIRSSILRYFYLAIFVLATPIYLIHSFAWTEPLFMSLLLFGFYALHRYAKHENRLWLNFSLLAFLMLPSIRLAGTFISVPIYLWLVLFSKSKDKWISMVFLMLLIGCFVFWTSNFHGILSQGDSIIQPMEFLFNFAHNLLSYFDGISLWLIPHSSYSLLRFGTGIFIVIGLGCLSFAKLRSPSLDVFGLIPLVFILYYFSLHPFFDIKFYTVERYLAPMYPLVLLAIFWWLASQFGSYGLWKKRIVIMILIIQTMYSAIRVSKNLALWHSSRCDGNYDEVIDYEKDKFDKGYEHNK